MEETKGGRLFKDIRVCIANSVNDAKVKKLGDVVYKSSNCSEEDIRKINEFMRFIMESNVLSIETVMYLTSGKTTGLVYESLKGTMEKESTDKYSVNTVLSRIQYDRKLLTTEFGDDMMYKLMYLNVGLEYDLTEKIRLFKVKNNKVKSLGKLIGIKYNKDVVNDSYGTENVEAFIEKVEKFIVPYTRKAMSEAAEVLMNDTEFVGYLNYIISNSEELDSSNKNVLNAMSELLGMELSSSVSIDYDKELVDTDKQLVSKEEEHSVELEETEDDLEDTDDILSDVINELGVEIEHEETVEDGEITLDDDLEPVNDFELSNDSKESTVNMQSIVKDVLSGKMK